MTSDRSEAIAALTRLGFTEYEAKVFVALHQLGTGTARDVHRITDVPRSQVYSVADALEEDGFVSIQHSTPKEYRPVSPGEAEELLTTQFERDRDAVIEYLESIERGGHEEEREEIWTVRGREAISNRVVELAEDATERIIFGTGDEALLAPAIERTLREQAARDVRVVVVSSSEAIRDRFDDAAGVRTIEPPTDIRNDDRTGRLLVVDRDTVLHSVQGEEELPGLNQETAYWSSESGFAATFISLMERTIGDQMEG